MLIRAVKLVTQSALQLLPINKQLKQNDMHREAGTLEAKQMTIHLHNNPKAIKI
jgi:hypothetical protein